MSIDFMNVPTEVIVGVLGMVILGVGGYIWEERKEGKKTNRIDGTTGDTKTLAVGIDGKIDSQSDNVGKQFDNVGKQFDNVGKQFDNVGKQFDNVEKQFDKQSDKLEKQSDKLDDINKYVAESRALKQAASGGGINVNQTIASIQSMASQIIELKDCLGRADRNETSLKQELSNAKDESENMRKEKQKLLQENKMLRSEINKYRSPHRKEREEEER